MPFDDQIRQSLAAAAADVRAHLDATFAALADSLARLSDEHRRQVTEQATADGATIRQQAQSLVDARTAAATAEADSRVTEVRRQADAQVSEVRRQAEAQIASQLAAAAATNDRRTADAVAETRAAAKRETAAAAARLVDAVRTLDSARTLGELLDGLAEAAAREAERAAVFVAKGDRYQGWRLVGFGPDVPPARSIDLGRQEFAPPPFARTAEGRDYLALPIEVGGSPVAILYADAPAGRIDHLRWRAVLEVWTRYVSRALEAMTVTRATGLMLPRPMAQASPNQPRTGANPLT